MKTIKRILPLLLIVILVLGMVPMGAFAAEDGTIPTEDPSGEITETAPSPEAEATTPPEAPPADTGSEVPDGPAETPEAPEATTEPEATPPEETAPPAAEETTSPQPEETDQPEPEASPSPVPEVEVPNDDEPSIEEPCGDGIEMGPNNPPEDAPMMFAAYSNSATIAVRSCYDSANNSIKYANSFQYDGRWVGGATYPRHIIYANGSPAYCLEPGKYLVGGSNVSKDAAKVWNSFSTSKRDAIKLAILCGAEGNASNLAGSYGSQYTATQMIVWEFVVGVRSTTAPYSVSDNKVINSVCYNGANPEVKTVYNQIASAMAAYNTLPSFANPLAAPPPQNELQYNGSTYTLTLTDSNNVLGNYNVTCTDNNVQLSVSGNTLTMTSTVPVSSATVNLTRKSTVSASSQIVAYGGEGLQETVIGIEAVSGTPGYFSIKSAYIPKGDVEIIKTSDDGHVSGIQFRITGGGIDQLVTTDSGGRVKVEGLKPGSYTVYEQVPEGYFSDRVSQSVTVRDRETATVTFNNTLKKWRVSVAKVDADGITRNSDATLEGAVYGVFKGGQLQDRYTTDSQGQFTTKYYPCDDDWTLRELESPTGYTVDPTEYPIGAEPGDFTQATKDMTLTVKERIIKGNLLIIKQDAETQTPLAGAKFRVLDSTGAMVAEGETGPDGRLAVDGLVYGDYQWQEVSPPKYFELDETLHDFSIEEDGVTVTVTCDDHRIPGSITVHKNDTKGNSLAGATYLLEWSADGSSWQPVSYRDDGEVLTGGCTSPGLANGQLTTGSDGTVTFSGLRADGEIKYRLTESKAPAGMSLLKDPIYTGTLPVEGDSDPIYDISATVTDTRITDLPMTGSSGLWPVTLGTALAGLAAVAGFFYTHKKSKRRSAA